MAPCSLLTSVLFCLHAGAAAWATVCPLGLHPCRSSGSWNEAKTCIEPCTEASASPYCSGVLALTRR